MSCSIQDPLFALVHWKFFPQKSCLETVTLYLFTMTCFCYIWTSMFAPFSSRPKLIENHFHWFFPNPTSTQYFIWACKKSLWPLLHFCLNFSISCSKINLKKMMILPSILAILFSIVIVFIFAIWLPYVSHFTNMPHHHQHKHHSLQNDHLHDHLGCGSGTWKTSSSRWSTCRGRGRWEGGETNPIWQNLPRYKSDQIIRKLIMNISFNWGNK